MNTMILCSTGAMVGRLNNRNYKIILDYATQIYCDGFEFMMYSSWYDIKDELVESLISSRIKFPTMHCDKQIGEYITKGNFELAYNLFEINCQIAKKIGASTLILHLWNGIISDSKFENNILAYDTLNKIALSYNLLLTVENVVCHFETPTNRLLTLYEKYPEISFTFDTKMASFHDELDLFYDENYSWLWQHTKHLHINDYAGSYMDWQNLKTLHIGDGHVNFDKFFKFIKSVNYNGLFTIEATSMNFDGSINVTKLNSTILKAKNYLI